MKPTSFIMFTSLIVAHPALGQDTPDAVVPGAQPFDMQVLTTDLRDPWEVTWGPDGFLWVTERTNGRIIRVDPRNGTKTVAVEIAEVSAPGGQDGLLGMALHPELLNETGNDFVYTAHTYVDEARGPDETVADEANPYRYLYTRIIRLSYDPVSGKLTDPIELVAGLPAGNDHNSGRMKIGPDLKLYFTVGDGGKGQLSSWCIPIEAQRLPSASEIEAGDFTAYQGKSLRINLDGSIPEDNPEIDGVRSHVFTYGHRNMQGIAFAPDGTLYASEHGPKADDEVNILLSGENYGWPHISGFRDDMAYQFARWADASTPCAELRFSDIDIHPSVPVEEETAWAGESRDPLATMFTVPSDWDFTNPMCGGMHFVCWPTVAPSSIDVYMPDGGGIPGWDNSLIVPTLKRGSLYRIPLTPDGLAPRGPIERLFQSPNRFRDVAIGPDSRTIYVITDSGGIAESPAGGTTFELQNPGSILAFTYTGEADTDTDRANRPEPDAKVEEPAALNDPAAGALPVFTTDQARRGRIAYEAHCASCHGPNLGGSTYGTPLAGAYFEEKWSGESVGAFYAYSHDTMPPSRPGDLPDQDYAAVVAYVLQVNGMAEGSTELPADVTQLGRMTIGR
ncbi:MAG: c-type cytochrome [Hyphomicrobiales bacterium]|nr:c-type cytochrome [Hyphomicrobiales bacterium]